MTITLSRVPVADVHPSLNVRGRVGDVDELALSLKVLGLQKPLIVFPRAGGQSQLAMATHAKGFDPMAEARGLHTLMFKHNLTREQISRTVGRTPAWVRDRIALVHLTDAEQRRVASGDLSIALALHQLAARRAERDGTPPPRTPASLAASAASAAVRVHGRCKGCRQHCPRPSA